MRHQFTQEERSRGGRVGGKKASREDKQWAGHLGFEATCLSHPWFARHWLQYMPGMRRSPQYRNAVARQNMKQSSNVGRRRPL